MKKLHPRLRKTITFCVSLFVFGLTMEVCARVDDKIKYNAPFFKTYSAQQLRTIDSEGLNCNVPNARFEKWKINRLGFRGPEIAIGKPKDKARIACMGTSETFGLFESSGKEWPAQLMDILGPSACFEIINTSVVGLPLDKFKAYIQKNVLCLEPDIIILIINPFGYAIGVDNFAKRQTGFKKEAKCNENERNFFLKDLSAIFHTLPKILSSNFRTLPKIKQAAQKVVPTETLKWYRLRNMKKQLRLLEYTRLSGRKPLDIVSRSSLERFSQDLEELIICLKGLKIEIVLSSYPVLISQENLNKHLEIFLDYRRFYVDLSLQGIIDASHKFNDVIKALAAKYQLAFIDNNSLIPKNTRYFADNVHYTDEGAKLVAFNFAQYIKNRWDDPTFVTSKSRKKRCQ